MTLILVSILVKISRNKFERLKIKIKKFITTN